MNIIQQIINEISQYIARSGGAYSEWYVGVAADPRGRLFNDHNVNEATGYWIYRDCLTDTDARSIEQYFLNQRIDGDSGGGDTGTKFVYAYRKTYQTNQ